MSPSPENKKYLEVACQLAQEAGEIIQGFRNQALHKEMKPDDSPVTAADLAADQHILKGLQQAFPDHGLLTEETGILGDQGSDTLWVIDPLDGTKAFVKGIPGYSVMIGCLWQGEPFLGVVFDPVEGRLYFAQRGQGCFQIYQNKKEKLRVSSRQKFSEMPLVVSTGFPDPKLEKGKKELGCPVLPPINSVGIKVGLLVRQVGDIYLNHHGVHYWDTCAPQVILEEAGGKITLLDGAPLNYSLDKKTSHPLPTLATNGTRHQDLLQIVQTLHLD